MSGSMQAHREHAKATTILEVIVGLTVHGIAVEDGLVDLALMTVVLEAAPPMLGFDPHDTWVKRSKTTRVRSQAGDFDCLAYGLCKFPRVASKGKPSMVRASFVPDAQVRVITPAGAALRR